MQLNGKLSEEEIVEVITKGRGGDACRCLTMM